MTINKNTKKYIFASLAVIAVIALVALAVSISMNNDGEENISGEATTTVGDRFSRLFGTEKIMVDKDNDGVKASIDCDDQDLTIGAASRYYYDADGDGFGSDSSTAEIFCPEEANSWYVNNNFDCDDANSAINPSATEFCNGYDDDCNEGIDEPSCSTLDLSIENAEAELELSTSTTADGMAVYRMTLRIEIVNNAALEDARIGEYYLEFPDYSTLLSISGHNIDTILAGERYILEESFNVYENIGEYDSIISDGFINVDVSVDLADTLQEANEYNNEEIVQAVLV